MKCVRELLNFIRAAKNVDLLRLAWFQNVVSLDNFPDAFLLLCKGGVLCFNLRSVSDLDGPLQGRQDLDVSEVKLFVVQLDDGTRRLSVDCQHDWDLEAINLNIGLDIQLVQNLSPKREIYNLSLVWRDFTFLDISLESCNPLRSLILCYDFKSGWQVVLINDLNFHVFLVLEERFAVVQHVFRVHSDPRDCAFCLDRDREHVLADSVEVNDQDHVVRALLGRREVDVDLRFLVASECASVVFNRELIVEVAAVARHSDGVLYVNL